jgi:hypothetical protein
LWMLSLSFLIAHVDQFFIQIYKSLWLQGNNSMLS